MLSFGVVKIGLEVIPTKDEIHQVSIFDIAPNPANEVVNIFFGDISGSADLVLSNAIGEIILTERISVSSNSQHKINTAGLSQGIYTLTITNDGNIANKRVIIQH